jgi:hypothetical protein
MNDRGGIIAFSLKHVPHNLVARELATRGAIGVRSGCHCAHLLVKRLLKIHPLRARAADLCLLLFPKFTSVVLPGLVRVSLGITNDASDIEHLLGTVRAIAAAPRSRIGRLLASTHNGMPYLRRTGVDEQVSDLIESMLERVYVRETPGRAELGRNPQLTPRLAGVTTETRSNLGQSLGNFRWPLAFPRSADSLPHVRY